MFIVLLFPQCRTNLKQTNGSLSFQSVLMSALHQRHINMIWPLLDQKKKSGHKHINMMQKKKTWEE